jgi:hypothetical protein
VQIDGGFDDFSNDEGGDVFGQPFPSLHVLVEIVAIDVLGDDIDVRLAADGLLVFDDLGM